MNNEGKKRMTGGLIAMAVASAVIIGATNPLYSALSKVGRVQNTAEIYTPGTYEAEEQGFGGPVSVSVTVDKANITDLKITGDSETADFGGAAISQLQQSILKEQTTEVDGYSGATITSTAVKTAVDKALAAARGEEVAEETEAETESAAPAAEGKFNPGTYSAEVRGMNAMTISVTFDQDSITAIEVEHQETDGLGAPVVDSMKETILEIQGLGIDAVSGATLTSNAMIDGVAECARQAGADVDALKAIKPEAKTAEDQELETDIVVIGGGGAGMTAAITAAGEGKSVIIVESQAMVGGNSVRATGGLNAAGTPAQQQNEFNEAAGVEKTLKSAADSYADNETITALAAAVSEQWAAYQANPDGYFDSPELMELDTMIGGKGINDPELVKTMCENSADAIEWLSSIGIDLSNAGAAGGASVKRIHRPVDADGKVISVGAYMVPLLEENCEKAGVQILYNTTATEILTDESGAACGIVATGSAGETVTVNAKAVVLATGGFGANLDMVTQYKPELAGFMTTNAPGIQGQGIEMAAAVGADTVDMDQIQIHPTVQFDSASLITEGLRGDGAILVNAEGKRFYDEVATRDVVSAAEIEQTGSFAWLIIDQAMADASSVIQGYIKKGYTFTGETYEELAKAIDIDGAAFAETMAKWNDCVKAGVDEEFGRTSFANPLDTAPYYAIKVTPGIHHTMGGVKINTSTEVLKADGSVIPGLFAAGEVTGGVHGANRLGGTAVTDFTVYGRIAGRSAAAYVK